VTWHRAKPLHALHRVPVACPDPSPCRPDKRCNHTTTQSCSTQHATRTSASRHDQHHYEALDLQPPLPLSEIAKQARAQAYYRQEKDHGVDSEGLTHALCRHELWFARTADGPFTCDPLHVRDRSSEGPRLYPALAKLCSSAECAPGTRYRISALLRIL
jgi:hypothetical protein